MKQNIKKIKEREAKSRSAERGRVGRGGGGIGGGRGGVPVRYGCQDKQGWLAGWSAGRRDEAICAEVQPPAANGNMWCLY